LKQIVVHVLGRGDVGDAANQLIAGGVVPHTCAHAPLFNVGEHDAKICFCDRGHDPSLPSVVCAAFLLVFEPLFI
jgi:hypothetical protein